MSGQCTLLTPIHFTEQGERIESIKHEECERPVAVALDGGELEQFKEWFLHGICTVSFRPGRPQLCDLHAGWVRANMRGQGSRR